MSSRSFTFWLHSDATQSRADAIGYLAREMSCAEDWPCVTGAGLRVYEEHLQSKGACDEAIEALRAAYAEWLACGRG